MNYSLISHYFRYWNPNTENSSNRSIPYAPMLHTRRCVIPLKLSRSDAIFEFFSFNPKISFNVNFECRFIELHRKDLSCINYAA